jgi:serine/threonine-protein kinase RsbT
MDHKIRIPIAADVDIVAARSAGRAMAAELGFGASDFVLIATAISELARNILDYARRGEILLWMNSSGERPGIIVVARDTGPGIGNIEQAMQDGYSSGRGLGLGLPGTRRLMDEFEIKSQPGKGTTVTAKKWVR